jgi:hypothetical protein
MNVTLDDAEEVWLPRAATEKRAATELTRKPLGAFLHAIRTASSDKSHGAQVGYSSRERPLSASPPREGIVHYLSQNHAHGLDLLAAPWSSLSIWFVTRGRMAGGRGRWQEFHGMTCGKLQLECRFDAFDSVLCVLGGCELLLWPPRHEPQSILDKLDQINDASSTCCNGRRARYSAEMYA